MKQINTIAIGRHSIAALTLILIFAATACSESAQRQEGSWRTLSGERPLVIAHRGASAHLPGHTMEAYALAIEQGADLIEPDLVLTKDEVLICRHDRYLSTTTNVSDHPEFADRRAEKHGRTDWWVEDFTLEEIRTLRSRQVYPHRTTEYNGQFAIPTFDELIALVKEKRAETGRPIGIIPEPKEAEQHTAAGQDIVSALVTALEDAGWSSANAPVVIQSFEAPVLQALNERIDVKLVQLTLSKTYFDANAPHESFVELDSIPAYADGVGPSRRLVVHDDGTVTDLIERAHALGLEVHLWTAMGDKDSHDGLSPEAETRRYFDLGIDGLFADDPEQAIRVREAWPAR